MSTAQGSSFGDAQQDGTQQSEETTAFRNCDFPTRRRERAQGGLSAYAWSWSKPEWRVSADRKGESDISGSAIDALSTPRSTLATAKSARPASRAAGPRASRISGLFSQTKID